MFFNFILRTVESLHRNHLLNLELNPAPLLFIYELIQQVKTAESCPTFSGALGRRCGRMRAPQGTMLRLRPPRISRAPRQAYISTRSWKRGLKAKEERPMLENARPNARVRRRVKFAMTVATMGVKTSPQPRPGGEGKEGNL